MVTFRLTRERNLFGVRRWVARTLCGEYEAKVPPGESRHAATCKLTRIIRKACKSSPVMRLVGN
jgi:hypothetical protein